MATTSSEIESGSITDIEGSSSSFDAGVNSQKRTSIFEGNMPNLVGKF
jgi:hypothetical protein